MIALAIVKHSPVTNPDRVFLAATVSDNYVTGGDTLNLTPSSWTDPTGKGVVGPDPGGPVLVPPSPFEENLGGYYCAAVPGTSLAAYKLKFYAPGGAELAAGAYPAAITGGNLVLELPFP